MTGEAALSRYLRSLAARDASPHTLRSYRGAIGPYLGWLDAAGVDWRRPSRHELRAYLAQLSAGRARRTVAQRLAARVGEQAIQGAGQMQEVESRGRRAVVSCPQAFGGHGRRHREDILARLNQGVGGGLQDGRDPRHGAAQPDFSGSTHRATSVPQR